MQSVGRIAAILRCFSPDNAEMSLSELARRMGLGKATAYRYATALQEAEILKWDEERKVYGIGSEPLRLASILIRSFSVENAAAPFLRRITASLDLTSTLAVWLDATPVVVACDAATTRIVRQEIALGTRVQPGHAAGLVLQAFGPPARMSQVPPRELAVVRETGVAINTNIGDGLRAISVPVIQNDIAIAALSVLGPLPILPDSTESDQVRLLSETAQELSRSIGGEVPEQTLRIVRESAEASLGVALAD
jgi:DNA-binding IclR family transcriptional regulator